MSYPIDKEPRAHLAHAIHRSHLDEFFSFSFSSHTTIDSHHLPTHPATSLSAQEMDHIRDLLGSADTVRRAEASNHLEHLLVLALEEEFSARRARGDGIHANALTHKVLGDDADHLLDRTFGGVVEEIARHDGRGLGEGGRNQNDM